MTSTAPIKLIIENFEQVWKMQRKNGKTMEFAQLLCQKLAEAAPALQLEAEFALLTTTPATIDFPKSKEDLLREQLELLKMTNEQLRRTKIIKYGTAEEKQALKDSEPDGLTAQEIADLYSVSVGSIRNYVDQLVEVGYRYTGEAGRMPILYSKDSAVKLAADREWIQRTDTVQVEMLQQKLDQQQGEAPVKEGKDDQV